MLTRKATDANFSVFDLTKPGFEPPTSNIYAFTYKYIVCTYVISGYSR